MPKKKITPLNEEFDFKLFVTIAKKNFSWLIFFLVLSIISSFLYLRYTPPVYEVGTIIKLSTVNDANKILDLNNNRFTDLNANQMAGDMELIRSRIIAEKALGKLKLDVSYFSKGTLLEFEMYKGSPFTVEAIPMDSNVYGINFFVEFIDEFSYELSYIGIGKEKIIHELKVGQWQKLPMLHLKLSIHNYKDILSQQLKFKTDAYYFVLNRTEDIAYDCARSLAVSPLNIEAKTISIKYKDKNANKASDIVNTISAEFINYDVQKSAEVADTILQFIDKTIDQVNASLSSSEEAIELFKRSNKVATPNALMVHMLDKIKMANDEKLNLDIEIAVVDKLRKEVLENGNVSSLVLNLVGIK